MKKSVTTKEQGFTIIEVMISIALFTVIVLVGMTALINAANLHNKTAKVRSILDNMSFVMEDMSRNLRTGDTYVCTDDLAGTGVLSPDCEDGQQIVFNNNTAGQAGEQWLYAFTQDGNIVKATAPDGSPAPILTDGIALNPPEVQLDNSSGFTVTGANTTNPPPDNTQPYVIIRLSGTITYKTDTIPFILETSVSQRLIPNISQPSASPGL